MNFESIKERVLTILQKHKLKTQDDRLDRFLNRIKELPVEDLTEELFELLVIENLTVGESYFFRDLKTFEKLEKLLKTKNEWNILSVGCSRGEEVYSLSILAKKLNVKCNILGIDMNHQRIQEARDGCYRYWSLRFLPEKDIDKYFVKVNERYCIKNEYKVNVSFLVCNINNCFALDGRKFDIIFLRRVLIYLDRIEETLHSVLRLLNDNGYLIIGIGEYFPELYKHLEPVYDDNGAILKKRSFTDINKEKHKIQEIQKKQIVQKERKKIENVLFVQTFENEIKVVEHLIERKMYDLAHEKVKSLSSKYPTEHLVWKYKALVEIELAKIMQAKESIKKSLFLNHYDEEAWQIKHYLDNMLGFR
ncbi:MAG: CheR family methyltransferase [Fervidobacterium sp.]